MPTTVIAGEPIINFTINEGTKADGTPSTTSIVGETVSGTVVIGACTSDAGVGTCSLTGAMEGDVFKLTATADNGLDVDNSPASVSVVASKKAK